MINILDFPEIWLVDFEFRPIVGALPEPICLVAKEFHTKKVIKLWKTQLNEMESSPFNESSLFVSYYSGAEFSCFESLGWSLPKHVIDLFVEFRNLTNQKKPIFGNGLLGALSYFGIDGIETCEKEEMRELAIRGGPWSEEEEKALINYCESDVVALEKLIIKFQFKINLQHALLRGEYTKAAAKIEKNGIPIDCDSLSQLNKNWEPIKDQLIQNIDSEYNCFVGRVFKRDLWEAWLNKNQIPWPRHPSGILMLDDETFSERAKAFPKIEKMRQLRQTLSRLRLNELAVGEDRRNRCMLSVFASKTGRNQPSSSKFIFGPSRWLRGLIKPSKGYALAYIDWSQQEFGIAAALSGDANMRKSYLARDPYLEFAKLAKAVPDSATKEDYPKEREQFKECVLAVQYGMGAEALALKINKSPLEAKELLRIHRNVFAGFWNWSEQVLNYANFEGKVSTVFGWQMDTKRISNPSTIRNFPMQANGAEMMRLACILAVEQGVKICAPVHDAFLIEAPSEKIEEHVKLMEDAMKAASAAVLSGFTLRSESKIIRYPDRYLDDRGSNMWATVWNAVKEIEAAPIAQSALPILFMFAQVVLRLSTSDLSTYISLQGNI